MTWWTWPALRGAVLEQIPGRLVDVGAGGCSVETASRLGPGTEIRGGRARRYSRLSPAGLRALSDAREAVEGLWRGIKWPLAKLKEQS